MVFIPWVHKLQIIITYIAVTTWVSSCVLALGRVVLHWMGNKEALHSK